MPCYDNRNDASYVRAEAIKAFMHNSPIAQMLCALMKQIESGAITEWPEGLWEWWEEHKARDESAKGEGHGKG